MAFTTFPIPTKTLNLPSFDVTNYGATGDGSTDDTTAIQAAIDAAVAVGRGTVYFPKPSSFYKCAGVLDLASSRDIILIGEGGRTEIKTEAETCPIVYTGTAAVFIDVSKSHGLRIEGLNIQYNNPSFAGELVSSNFGLAGGVPGYNLSVRNCTFGGSSNTITGGRSGLYLAGMVRADIRDNAFYWMDYGIIGYSGASGDTPYSTAITVEKNWFNELVEGGVANPHQQWSIRENVFEPLITSGNAGGIKCGVLNGGLSNDGLLVIGNGFWDVTTGAGAWIEFAGNGLVAIGNYVNIGDVATFIKSAVGGAGIFASGNRVTGSAGATFVNANGQTITQFADDGSNVIDGGITILANAGALTRSSRAFNMLTATQLISGGVAGSPIADAAGAGTGSTPSVSGGQLAGKISLTAGSSPGADSNIMAVAWAEVWSAAPKCIILTPANENAAALSGAAQVYVDASQTTTDRFFIKSGNTGLADGVVYEWFFQVVQ